MLRLKLTPDTRFSHDNYKGGKIAITFDDNSAGDDDIVCNGNFSLVNSGNAVDAAVTANGDFANAVELNSPADITADLTATFTRTLVFTAGACDTGIVLPKESDAYVTTEFTGKVSANGATVTLSAEAHADKPSTLKLAIDDADGKVDVTFTNVKVASGVCEDPDCNGAFKVKQLGPVHVDAICNWYRPNGLKPNPTSFTIRALDEHTITRTLQ